MLNIPGKNFSFLLRLRIATDDAGKLVVRGALQRIGAAQVHNFASFDVIARILQDVIAATPSQENPVHGSAGAAPTSEQNPDSSLQEEA